jgi:mannose-6-phosphate isomerase-like protein (cupin superfamily)
MCSELPQRAKLQNDALSTSAEAGLNIVSFYVNYLQMKRSIPDAIRRQPVVLEPQAGRHYAMGRIDATFKADEAETAFAYSISEWWLEPNTTGPGAHAHAEDDVFYVLEGTMSILVGERWVDAKRGAFVLVPGGTTHDFENRSSERAGILNFSPGPFEQEMPGIAAWFREHPPGPA